MRLALWQNVLAFIGILVGAIALYAALNESAAVRQQTAAAVWPFVQMTIEDRAAADDAHFAISFTNVGVGPARMGQLRILVDGQPARTLSGLTASEPGAALPDISRNFLSNRVISPGESITLLSTNDPARVAYFRDLVARPASSLSYCYCSIFDACWLIDSQRNLHEPEAVAQCPDFAADAYQPEA
ncbi:hypothetical protein E4634_14360 [Mangrovimicrobium sediminis]|uniref:Uncharacterized protein n=1 Tax=Mangrovimicrobium sediminis TaxID=2562682 RepID=A0A4Z0LZK0_9GAMM|nr:hypothetical protein [Haliea sp. SAOS-164]TGD72699.1 hypothetical protein E4634_14360 [Haliea sp. SAOS-164]